MKSTETWVLRHLLSTQTSTNKYFSSTRHNYAKGITEHLLSTGTIIKRPKVEGEVLMPIFLLEEYFDNVVENGKLVRKRFLQKSWEINKDKGEDKDKDKLNRATIEFLQSHNEVDYKSLDGKQLNSNFPNGARAYFSLVNMDAKETEKANIEVKYNELVGEVIAIREDVAEFHNLAFGLGINPNGLSDDLVFNLIKAEIQKNPTKFEQFIKHDNDKYHKIVINKALRTDSGEGSNYLVQDELGNFKMKGQLLAPSFDNLILYFKENTEMFGFLEDALGFKKNEKDLASQTTKPKKSKAVIED